MHTNTKYIGRGCVCVRSNDTGVKKLLDISRTEVSQTHTINEKGDMPLVLHKQNKYYKITGTEISD